MKEIILGNDDITIVVGTVKLNKSRIQNILLENKNLKRDNDFLRTEIELLCDGGVSNES